jgi:hypothetical protein
MVRQGKCRGKHDGKAGLPVGSHAGLSRLPRNGAQVLVRNKLQFAGISLQMGLQRTRRRSLLNHKV